MVSCFGILLQIRYARGSNFVEIANFAGVAQSIQKRYNDLLPHVLTILGDFTRYIRLILYENNVLQYNIMHHATLIISWVTAEFVYDYIISENYIFF